jgi:hypothetical protein
MKTIHKRSADAVDVVVVGGGPAGVAASVAASRTGAKTLLVERYGFLGGAATASLVSPWGGVFLRERKVTCSFFDEVLNRMVRLGGAIGYAFYSETTRGWGGCYVPFDPEVLKYVLQEIVLESGAELVFHAVLKEAIVRQGRITHVHIWSRGEEKVLEPTVVVDATGDGDLVAMAGLPFAAGRVSDGLMQPMTLMARVAGVRTEELKDYVRTRPEEFAWAAFPRIRPVSDAQSPYPIDAETLPVAASGFISLLDKGRKTEELYFGRTRFLFVSGLRKGELYLNATRVAGQDGTDVRQITYGEQDARRQITSLFDYLKRHAPGFQDAYLVVTGCQIGIRETRRVVGRYTLTLEDILESRPFPDTIARGCYPVDIHEVDGVWGSKGQKEGDWIDLSRPYNIPLRCLTPKEGQNLLVAGRCISTTHEALGSVRIQPTCMATGQAAGTAASLMARSSGSIDDLDIEEVQRRLDL